MREGVRAVWSFRTVFRSVSLSSGWVSGALLIGTVSVVMEGGFVEAQESLGESVALSSEQRSATERGVAHPEGALRVTAQPVGMAGEVPSKPTASAWRPSFQIPAEVRLEKVSGANLTLGDIAVFSEGAPEFAPLVRSLRAIPLGVPPEAGLKSSLLGVQVLEKIQKAGFPSDSFGYTMPQVIVVERLGRAVTKEEVVAAAKERLWGEKHLEIQVRDVSWSFQQTIPIGKTAVSVEPLGEPSRGSVPVRIEVFVDERPAARFLATATVDDWREVPVLTREVQRGQVISASDVEMVRLNLSHYPGEVIRQSSEAVGYRVKSRIAPGEGIRRNQVDLPPTIVRGGKVKAIYRKGALVASLSAVAVEDGFLGESVRIKNESSKKVLTGKVLSGEEVEITE